MKLGISRFLSKHLCFMLGGTLRTMPQCINGRSLAYDSAVREYTGTSCVCQQPSGRNLISHRQADVYKCLLAAATAFQKAFAQFAPHRANMLHCFRQQAKAEPVFSDLKISSHIEPAAKNAAFGIYTAFSP
jgi:hypothetical protein